MYQNIYRCVFPVCYDRFRYTKLFPPRFETMQLTFWFEIPRDAESVYKLAFNLNAQKSFKRRYVVPYNVMANKNNVFP